jgi:uncharacterized protein
VISLKKYLFSNPVFGTLELEIDSPAKQVFQGSVPRVFNWKTEGLQIQEPDNSSDLFFFEWQKIHYSYIVSLSPSVVGPIEIRVNDRIIKKSSEQNGVIFLSGYFSFEDAVGETRIELRDFNNRLIFKLETEVFPQKMDYCSDYKVMMAEISQVIQNLTYDTLKDTYQRSKARTTGHATENEWWNILDGLFEYLVINLGVISRQAKHEIQTSGVIQPVEKIRQTTKHHTNWFKKNQKYSNKIQNGVKVGADYYTHAPSKKKFVTYDTWENRFIAWAIRELIEKLRKYHKLIESKLNFEDSSPYSPVLKRIKKYQSRLQGILHENPFNEVGSFEKRAHFSTSLTRGAGYRDFMHIYLLLSRGLELADNEIFKIELKNISTLYEYWSFLKLVQITKELHDYDIAYQDLIKVRANRVEVKLKNGESSRITFKKKDSNETTTIHYNKEYRRDNKKVFTFDQVPDYTISFKKEGFEKPFWYLFDAKYRFDEKQNQVVKTYDVPQDAIGQLHRYRDAILHSEPSNTTYRSAIKNLGGVILYPYPLSEESFVNNNFFKSLKEVNIGALPFLPSKTKLVTEFLKTLINKPPEAHFEQIIEMDRSEYDQHRNKWKEWVTIDVIKRKDQAERLKFLLEKEIHHIPFVKNTHSKVYSTNHLLLCKAGSKKAFLYEVESREIIDYKHLHELGANWNLSHSQYISFKLKFIEEFNTPAPIAPISFRYSSLEGLNKFLKEDPPDKNYFYLTNPDAARLYEELKLNNVNCQIKWVENLNDPSLIKFVVNDKSILSSDLFPNLHFNFEDKLIHLFEIIRILLNED